MTARAIKQDLKEIACPCCGGPVMLRTDSQGKAYTACQNMLKDEARGTYFHCHFHMKYGAHHSAQLVRDLIGGPPANVNGPPTGSGGNPPASDPETKQNQTEESAHDEPQSLAPVADLDRTAPGTGPAEARPDPEHDEDDEPGFLGG